MRLLALNEVGGDPGRFSLPVEDFHARCAERARRFEQAPERAMELYGPALFQDRQESLSAGWQTTGNVLRDLCGERCGPGTSNCRGGSYFFVVLFV